MKKDDRKLSMAVVTALAEEAEHSYEVPELIFLPIQDGLRSYLSWMDEELL